MMPLSSAHFRVAVLATILGLVLSLVVPSLGVVSFAPEVEAARSWNYFDSVLPGRAVLIWYVIWGVVALAGLVGSYFFWRPARWLLAASVLLSVVAQPFLGLVVYSPFEASFAAIPGMLMLWLVTVSFWSPLAGQFAAKQVRVP